MSDLQCAARVILARHGDAEYETPLLMNHGGSLTAQGRAQARELGGRLRRERIAHVYTSVSSRAVQTAELAAEALGVGVTVREGLVELALGEAQGLPAGGGYFDDAMAAWVGGDLGAKLPGSESAAEIAARVRPVLEELADQHRGEAVLVVTHGGAIVATLAALAFAPGRSTHVPNASSYELVRDDEGWCARHS